MGKVICAPGLSRCHIIYYNFQFKALICFYFIARVKHASFPAELSHAHYSFCAVWRSAPEWTVKSWKLWRGNDRSEEKGSQCQRSCEYPLLSGKEVIAKSYKLQHQKCRMLYLNINITLLWIWETIAFAREGVKKLKMTQWLTTKILHIRIVSLEVSEENLEVGGCLGCLQPTCFATHWTVWLCKKGKFSPFLTQWDVKTLGWGCLLE